MLRAYGEGMGNIVWMPQRSRHVGRGASKKKNTGFPLWHCVNAPSAAHTQNAKCIRKISPPPATSASLYTYPLPLPTTTLEISPVAATSSLSSLSHSILSNSVKRFHLLL